jgi:glycosyltransferase involved in cell wall biosynthesis
VGAAIESILNQTFEDFEFLIIDDGSNDETPEVLKRYNDPRIRHIRHENRGLAGTLNVGIELALGKYIARQDQDDISLPDRLERQFSYMEQHSDCALLGTWAQIMEGDRLVDRFHRHPTAPSAIQYALLLNNPFAHSSVVFRTEVARRLGGYTTDPSRQPPEDFEFWSRIARVATIANLPEILLHYREVPGSMSRQGPSPFQKKLVTICSENIAFSAGVDATNQSARNIAAITHGAKECISGNPSFKLMESVFLKAAHTVAGDPQDPEILSDAKNRIHAMRATYILARSPLRRWVLHDTPLRRFLKAIYRRNFSKVKP